MKHLSAVEASQFAEKWLPAWTGNDPERLASFYSDDAFYLDPGVPAGIQGKAALLAYFRKLLAVNPQWVWTHLEGVPLQDGFLNKWLARIPVGPNTLEVAGVCSVQLDDAGKIRRNEVYFDRTLLLAEIAKYKASALARDAAAKAPLVTAGINGIAHIQLTVSNMERSIPFYEKLLHTLQMVTLMKTSQFFYCIGGRTAVAISPASADVAEQPFNQRRVGLHHVCFRARSREDVDVIYRTVLELSAKIIRAPQEDSWAPGYYSVLFEDPDGIRIEANFVPGKGHLEK